MENVIIILLYSNISTTYIQISLYFYIDTF